MIEETEKAPPRHIGQTDAADLRWYFSTGRRQIEGSSNFGAMLERLKQFGIHARPCLDCGGQNAVTDAEGNTITPERDGSGFVWSSKEWERREMLKNLGLLTGEVAAAWNGDLVCKTCKGRGVIPGKRKGNRSGWNVMKVNETPSASSDADTGGNASLARLGHVSRLLGKLKRHSELAYVVAEAYYSPGGESEACLWHLTPAGKTMLRRNSLQLPERQFFANERNRQAEDPNTERALLFQAAERQSVELKSIMVQAWLKVTA